ncbi:FAD-dependent oxidoreductase [Actinophytocola sp.]|uniref:FAD-dependent oxidoreductase n=1 Tax=Actinophytocola sp. TaxID=1872138 RepID=UPI00389AA83E
MAELVVVGGGIGGLSTALSVARRGHRVVVLERGEFAEFGAGIQLAANGIHALDRLGIDVRASAVHVDELRFMDGVTGNHVASVPLTGEYERRFRNPYLVVHRGDLYRLLLAACRGSAEIALRANTYVTGYEQDGATASAVLDTGERVSGDALVGADGIRSSIRRQLVGDGPPRISGITVYRAIVPMADVPPSLRWPAVTWWAGPGCHFVHYPIAGGEFLNLAASDDNGATEAIAGVDVPASLVLARLSGLAATPRRLLELGRDWKSWVLVDRPPVANWTDRRVTLLGDAAHPMLHYAAQGACQALEDAVLLGELLDCAAAELGQRFEKYNAARRERTARIQRISLESIKLWHPAGAAAAARNAALAAMSTADFHDELAWMHGVREFGAAA